MKEDDKCSECDDGIYTRTLKDLRLPSPHGTVVVSVNALCCGKCDDELIPNDQLNKISIALLSAKLRDAQKKVDSTLTDVLEELQTLSEQVKYK